MKIEMLCKIDYTFFGKLLVFNSKYIKSEWLFEKFKSKPLAKVYLDGNLWQIITLD